MLRFPLQVALEAITLSIFIATIAVWAIIAGGL